MALLEQEFNEFLDEQFQPQDESWRVRSDDEASWCLRKIKHLQEQQAEREAFVQREIDRLRTWQQEQDDKEASSVAFFTVKLQEYYLNLGEKLNGKKSYKLPFGTLQMRKKPAKLERDDEKLMELARPLGLVKVKESLDWAELKKQLVIDGYKVVNKETGELVEGITVVEAEGDEFSIKVD